MAHAGSVAATAVKALTPSEYQKEWSRATARSNCGWAAALQETGKWTVPSFSVLVVFSWAPAVETQRNDAMVTTRASRLFVSRSMVFASARPRHSSVRGLPGRLRDHRAIDLVHGTAGLLDSDDVDAHVVAAGEEDEATDRQPRLGSLGPEIQIAELT